MLVARATRDLIVADVQGHPAVKSCGEAENFGPVVVAVFVDVHSTRFTGSRCVDELVVNENAREQRRVVDVRLDRT